MRSTASTKPLFNPRGLHPILDTSDFDQWSEVVGSQLGDHRSELTTSAQSFKAVIHSGKANNLGLLHIQGQGKVQLDRVQANDRAVFWMPLQGLSEEIVNRESFVASPGMAMVLRPGDVMVGRTTHLMEGLSILIPADRIRAGLPALLHQGKLNRALIEAGYCFAKSVGLYQEKALHAEKSFLNQLAAWQFAMDSKHDGPRERITIRRRRQVVADAIDWMVYHLETPFEVGEIAEAAQVSIRTLQYAFRQELGVTPMAEAKRLRMHRLRDRLMDNRFFQSSIADLMKSSGLLAAGSTAVEYRHYFGETPRQSRQH